jgi:hypothetical protein
MSSDSVTPTIRARAVCYYYNRPGGCRSGEDQCSFLHVKDSSAGIAQNCQNTKYKCKNKTRPGYQLCPPCYQKSENSDDCGPDCDKDDCHTTSVVVPVAVNEEKIIVKEKEKEKEKDVLAGIPKWADAKDDDDDNNSNFTVVQRRKSSGGSGKATNSTTVGPRVITCCKRTGPKNPVYLKIEFCGPCVKDAEKNGSYIKVHKCRSRDCRVYTPMEYCSRCWEPAVPKPSLK